MALSSVVAVEQSPPSIVYDRGSLRIVRLNVGEVDLVADGADAPIIIPLLRKNEATSPTSFTLEGFNILSDPAVRTAAIEATFRNGRWEIVHHAYLRWREPSQSEWDPEMIYVNRNGAVDRHNHWGVVRKWRVRFGRTLIFVAGALLGVLACALL
ncbi:MAG: hypothetical protein IT290_07975 [Deltaproteobacteria bacterium]|nr:hypothetical protein [Deltaproteobacteria bacterium]